MEGEILMRLKVIIPNNGMDEQTLKDREEMLSSIARPDTIISVDCISHGPVSIESAYDEVLVGPELVQRCIQAERDGFDSIVIYCLSDPAVNACREMVHIPVIGPGQVSMAVASSLGYKFSILTVLDETISKSEESVRHSGVDPSRLVSVRSIQMPVVNVRKDISTTIDKLVEVGNLCVELDRSHVLILGCLGFAGMSKQVATKVGVPVIDSAFLSVNFAEMLYKQQLTFSKKAYPYPSEKEQIL